MNQQIKKRYNMPSFNKTVAGIAAGVVLFLVVLVTFIGLWQKTAEEKSKVKQGISYLESLEKQEVSEINDQIKTIETDLNLNLAEGDDTDAIWSQFENAVIIGDSRALGFSYWEFVPEEQVLAKGGGKITDIQEEYIDQLKVLAPSEIYLCFGLNDVGIGFWPEPADYVAVYEETMELLAKTLPDCSVYINSILPAVGVGLEADPNYPRIGEYNDALAAMSSENGYHYIDNTPIAEQYVDLYQDDGLHVQEEFYKYWAANMLAGVEA